MLVGVRVLALLLTLVAGDLQPTYETEEAQAAVDEGKAAYAEEAYDEAAQAFARAHALETDPPPNLIYALAQAERKAGRCVRAAPLYIEFLDTPASPGQAAHAKWNLSVCIASMSLDAGACEQAEAQLARLKDDAETEETWARQFEELEARLKACRQPESAAPAAAPDPEPPPPVVQVTTTPEPTLGDRRRVDPWGLAMGSASLLAAGAAVGLFLGSQAQLEAVSLEGTHGRGRARHESGRGLQAGVISAAAVAGGLATGAVVHWIVWGKRQRTTAAARR